MRKKILSRFASILFAISMLVGIVGTCYAADNEKQVITTKSEALTKAATGTTVSVSANGTADIELELQYDGYVGRKKIYVNAMSDSTSGALLLYLYNPSGTLVSNDWIMGVNELVQWNVVLPPKGTWRLHIVASGTTAPTSVFARWE